MYEQESQRSKSERVKETLKTDTKKGLFKGSTLPYGYTSKDGKSHIRDNETPKSDGTPKIFYRFSAPKIE